jgi:hypothetical protein
VGSASIYCHQTVRKADQVDLQEEIATKCLRMSRSLDVRYHRSLTEIQRGIPIIPGRGVTMGQLKAGENDCSWEIQNGQVYLLVQHFKSSIWSSSYFIWGGGYSTLG